MPHSYLRRPHDSADLQQGMVVDSHTHDAFRTINSVTVFMSSVTCGASWASLDMRTTTDGGSLGYELLIRRVMMRQVSAESAVALSAIGVQVSMMQSWE